MSLQPNNINKFPKHLQHVRIQKEEEEDLWISGEELCTEGSSDEENTNDVKKKSKSRATPLKEALKAKKSTSSLTSTSTRESDDEFSDRMDIQKSPTNWRPKRGSIKLPNIEETFYNNYYTYPELENDKWETEYEYGNALKDFKNYKNHLNDVDSENTYENLNNLANEIESEHSEKVSEMETEIELITKELEMFTQQRKQYEQEVCKELNRISNSSPELKSTQSFYEISNYKPPKSESFLQPINKRKKKSKKIWKRKPKYTPRVRRKMSELSLSDEERTRLEFLLSDIDVAEYKENEKESKTCNKKNCHNHELKLKLEDIINTDNAFNQTDEEKIKLNELNEQLKTLQECDDADLKGNISEDITDEENREWYVYLQMKIDRFRRIDEKINTILAQDKEHSTEHEDPMDTSQET